MSKKNSNKTPVLEHMEIIPLVDKYLIVKTLYDYIDESGNIAEYIGDNIRYGRALGYSEGKHAAYVTLAEQILDGKFDAGVVMEDGYEYEM